ncbi:netrin-G1-like [Sinocyclocheilus grahami]|uniref:Netrin G1 n=1 Tax=Sinocyclocheilus grahami TaxID=75366 RepID=A0A672PG72_SINGR|nr:PREDICTED: netrin-G1-like [Sinocyclocheilus grahami]XP_016140293.1 PREDICTED: netrin-G1-like [Sinocyclocheilus grahami]
MRHQKKGATMYLLLVFVLQALWVSWCHATQHYPASWGHYDVCKSQVYAEDRLAWHYMACQPEATDMTKYLTVSLDPPNITCGDPPEMYCALENPYMCNNECDADTEELAHPPELMFDSEGRNPTTFWQSTSWKKYPKPLQVNITLSWNKTIELTDDIVLTFESGRPEQLVLEKSLDYGRTWQPYQFYASDCLDAFTMEPKAVHQLNPSTMLEIICTEAYSTGYVWKYDKTVRFEIKDRFALLAGPRLHNMASLYGQLDTTKNLRDFFTLTDLRIRLLRPATGATMVDENNLSRYFYAISDIKVQGRCKCNLHANSCVFDKGKLGCECEHNTTGPDCARCKRHYQGRAWSMGSYLPIPKGTANICILNNLGTSVRPNASSLGAANRNQARVCDNVLLRCQNGGVCHHHQRCQCLAGFGGILCEKAQCQGDSCEDLQSSQPSLCPPPAAQTLPLALLSLIPSLLATRGLTSL